jgi:predicted phosphodiesterase
MKILIIPDIHGRRFWKHPVEKYIDKVDKIVMLGDIGDPYNDETTEPIPWEQVSSNFEEIIKLKRDNPDKVVLLLGNHDEHYRNEYYARLATSTRYDRIHSRQLFDLFNHDNYNLFKICHEEIINDRRIVFSHAGITNYWLESAKIKNDETMVDKINHLEDSNKGIAKLAIIGKYRTWLGEKTGSPLWCDLREFISNERPSNFYQIFGHTKLRKGEIVSKEDFSCVDSRIAFMIDDDFKITKINN